MTGLPDTPEQIVSKLLSERRRRPAIGEYAAPQDELEKSVSEIWSEILHIDQIGRDDNLFILDGDSLDMARIAARIHRRFGVDIPVGDFFDYPTVAGIASILQSSHCENRSGLEGHS